MDYDYVYIFVFPILFAVALAVLRNSSSSIWWGTVTIFVIIQVSTALLMAKMPEHAAASILSSGLIPFCLPGLLFRIPLARKYPLVILLGTIPLFWVGSIIGIWIYMGFGYGL